MGELAALASAALWAAASLVFAVAGLRLPSVSMNLLKTGLALIGLALTSLALEGHVLPGALEGSSLAWLALSGLLGLTLGDSLFFAALRLMGPHRTLVTWAMTPAATAGLGAVFLGEAVTVAFLLGLFITSFGVGIVLVDGARPEVGTVRTMTGYGLLAALGAVFCQAAGSITAKLGGLGLTSLDLSVIRLGFGTVGLLLPGIWALRSQPAALDRKSFGQVVAGTFIGTYLGMWVWMYALQSTHAGLVATLQSTSPVFALALTRVVYGQRISMRAALGSGLAAIGVGVLTAS